MIFNLAKILNSNNLMTKVQAEDLISQLSEMDWLKLKEVTVSFKDVNLVTLDFLIPFVEFLHNIDMQDLNDEIKVSLDCDEQLHRDLFIEAYKVVRSKK